MVKWAVLMIEIPSIWLNKNVPIPSAIKLGLMALLEIPHFQELEKSIIGPHKKQAQENKVTMSTGPMWDSLADRHMSPYPTIEANVVKEADQK